MLHQQFHEFAYQQHDPFGDCLMSQFYKGNIAYFSFSLSANAFGVAYRQFEEDCSGRSRLLRDPIVLRFFFQEMRGGQA